MNYVSIISYANTINDTSNLDKSINHYYIKLTTKRISKNLGGIANW